MTIAQTIVIAVLFGIDLCIFIWMLNREEHDEKATVSLIFMLSSIFTLFLLFIMCYEFNQVTKGPDKYEQIQEPIDRKIY